MRPARSLWLLAWTVGILLLLGTLAASAFGTTFTPNVVGTVDDPHVGAALAVADQQWRDIGLEPDCELAPLYLFDNPGFAAGASDKRCSIGYQAVWLAENLAQRNSPDVYVRRWAFDGLCHATVHEKGHLLGYEDMDPAPLGGIMYYGTNWTAPLPRCASWVDAMAPLPPEPAATPTATPPLFPVKGSGTSTLPGRYCGPRCKRRARLFVLHRCQKRNRALRAAGRPTKLCSSRQTRRST